MEELLKKYPDLQKEYYDDREIYFTPMVNTIVNQFEEQGGGFVFYIQEGNYKIYADPRGCYTVTDTGYEYDWLNEIINDEINPEILVKVMRHVNSKYLTDKDYHRKMPYLKEWLSKY